ncbi:MAG: HEAT repeat domain-containing protein [Planctomycetota bacterium]
MGVSSGMGVRETFAYLDRLPHEQQRRFCVAALVEPNAELQETAIARLLAAGARDGADLVVAHFVDLLPSARTLAASQAPQLVAAAHAELYSDKERHRQNAYAVLAEFGDETALEALAVGLTDGSARVRDLLVAALERHLRAFVQRCRGSDAPAAAALTKEPAWRALADALRGYSAHRQATFVELLVELGASATPLVAEFVFGRRDALLQQAFTQELSTSRSQGAAELVLALALGSGAVAQAAGNRILRQRRENDFGQALSAALAALPPARATDLRRLGSEVPWLELVVPAVTTIDDTTALRLLDLAATIELNTAVQLKLVDACHAHAAAAVRRAAVERLGALQGVESLATLTVALADSDAQTQLVAAHAIIKKNPANKVALLTPLLGSSAPEVRDVAVREISKVSFAHFLQRFDQMQQAQRETTARTLRKVDPLMMQRLTEEVAALDPARRLKALRIVECLDAERELRTTLLELLHDRDHRVRATALRIVDCSKSVEAMRILVDALSDRDRRVRANAIEAFEQFGDAQFVPLLVPFLDDPDNRVRANACKALCRLGATMPHAYLDAARRALLRMLDHESEAMRASAAWALGELGFQGAHEALEARAAVEQNRRVVARLRRSLDSLQNHTPPNHTGVGR